MTILDSLVAVHLTVNQWSARVKLRADDFPHGELPPNQLASLGSKRLCSSEDLKCFGKLKSRAQATLEKVGIRFLGGFAIPESKVPEVMKALEELSNEFAHEKSKFIANYDQKIDSWIKQNKGWEQIIADSLVSASYVEKKINFSWQMFKVAQPKSKDLQATSNGLNSEVKNLGNTLFEEISKSAKATWDKSYKGKKDITRKALSPLKTMYSKLSELTFIEPKVQPVVDLIKAALDKIPSRGLVDGHSLLMLQGLVALLSDTKALLNYAQEMIEGRSSESILQILPNDLSLSAIPAQLEAPIQKVPNVEKENDSQKLASMGLW